MGANVSLVPIYAWSRGGERTFHRTIVNQPGGTFLLRCLTRHRYNHSPSLARRANRASFEYKVNLFAVDRRRTGSADGFFLELRLVEFACFAPL
jgi:hypothetical protein